MPFINAHLHYMWATKNRSPIISKELKPLLLEHIKENAIKKDIFIDTINCVTDHIHLLVSLNSDMAISKLANLVKGESSLWVNRQGIIARKFEWQDDYIAISVSPSVLKTVRKYIYNQEEHHKKVSWNEEYEGFLKSVDLKKADKRI